MLIREKNIAILTLLMLMISSNCGENDNQCKIDSSDGCTNSGENKYARQLNNDYEKWGEYLSLIENAEMNHVDCGGANDDEECPCYDELIKKDLDPFGKIT